MRKGCLYEYGGRPVIYGDQDLLDKLSEDYKHLWVRFNPIPNADFGGYPIDWTHEREWRVRVKEYHYSDLGLTPPEGVPLLMPLDSQSTKPTLCLPWILVKSWSDSEEMKQFIRDLPPYSGTNGVLQQYYKNLSKIFVIPLEEVELRLARGEANWERLDTLPVEELYPGSSSFFTKIGWNQL